MPTSPTLQPAASSNLAREWGAFEMRNPVVIRGDHNVVGELMGEFHERDYIVDGGRGCRRLARM